MTFARRYAFLMLSELDINFIEHQARKDTIINYERNTGIQVQKAKRNNIGGEIRSSSVTRLVIQYRLQKR